MKSKKKVEGKSSKNVNKTINKKKSDWKCVWWLLGVIAVFILVFIIVKFSFTGYAVNLNLNPETMNPDDPLGTGFNPETLPQTPEEWKNKSTDYLKSEWVKILGNSKYGWIFLGIRDTLIKLNFFWKPVLGMEYSLSWLFIFALALWLILFFIISDLVIFISDKSIIRGVAAFCITSLAGTSGIIKKGADMLSFIITNTWLAWLALIIAILIMFLIIRLGGGLKESMKNAKEKQAQETLEKDRAVIHTEAKVAGKQLDAIKNASK